MMNEKDLSMLRGAIAETIQELLPCIAERVFQKLHDNRLPELHRRLLDANYSSAVETSSGNSYEPLGSVHARYGLSLKLPGVSPADYIALKDLRAEILNTDTPDDEIIICCTKLAPDYSVQILREHNKIKEIYFIPREL